MTLDDKLSSGLTRAGDSMQKFGSNTMILSGAVAALGGAAVISAMKFDKTMTLLTSLAGVASKDLQEVREHILALGPAVGKGPQELAEAMMAISSTTDDTVNALKILDVAAKLSATGMGETKEVGRALTAIINSYGSANISAAKAADILTQTVKDGGAEATELAGVLSNVIPAAAQMGIEFEQVGAFIATVTKLGTPAAEAVTQLSAVMTALTKETKEGTEALASIGMSYDQLRKAAGEDLQGTLQNLKDRFGDNATALSDVFGRIEAFRGVLGVTGAQAKTYAAEVDRMTRSVGAAEKAHAVFEASASAKWEKFTAAFSTAAVELGAELVPALMKTLDAMKPLGTALTSLIKAFSDAPTPIRTITLALFGLVAVMGPLAFAVGNIVTAVGTIGGVLITAANSTLIAKARYQLLTAQLWLADAAAKAVTLSVGTMAAVLAVGVGTFFITTWLMEVTGLRAALDGLIDDLTGLTQHEDELNAAYEKRVGTSDRLAASTAVIAKLNEKLKKDGEGLITVGTRLAQVSDADIAAKLKGVRATDDLAKATELYGEKVTDPKLAARIIAIGKAWEDGAASAKKLAKELDALEAALQVELLKAGAEEVAKLWVEGLDEIEAATKEFESIDWAKIGKQAAGAAPLRDLDKVLDPALGFWTRYADVVKQETENATDGVKKHTEEIGLLEKMLGDLPDVIMGAIQGGGDVGEAIGASIGGNVGEVLGTTLGGPIGGAIGKLAGTVIGSKMGEALTTFFGGAKWKETGRLAGEVLGGEVSEELARKIHDAKFEFGISGENAALLFIQDFVDETGKSAVEVGPQLTALMDAIATGAVPAAEGLEAINGLFDELVIAAEGGDAAAKKLTQTLIQQGLAAGQLSESMQAFVQEAASKMAAGSLKILEGISLIEAPLGKMGTAAAQMFAAGFTAQIAEVGLVQALVDSGEQIEEMFAKLTEEGNTAAAAMLAPFVQLSAAINNEADPSVRGFLITLQGMSEVFAGLDQLGFVTQDAFSGLTAGIHGTVNALAEAGVVGPSAMMAIAPQLAQIIQASERYGFAIDADTQALIDQAKAAGVAFPTDPIQALISLVEQMVVLMGGTLPEAAERIAPAVEDAASSASDSITSLTDGLEGSFADASVGAVTSLGMITTAIAEIPDSKDVKISVSYENTQGLNFDGTPDFDNDPTNSFQGGSLGFKDFGSGTPTMLHGREEVITQPQGESLAGMVGAAIREAMSDGGGGGPRVMHLGPFQIGGAQVLDEIILQRTRTGWIQGGM